jgi:ribonuclease HI
LNPGISSCGGIFRSNAQFLGCFAGLGNSFMAEISRAMRTMEIAKQRNYNHLWLETDSKPIVLAFKYGS